MGVGRLGHFTVFFASRDEPHHPLAEQLASLKSKLEEGGGAAKASLSVRNGRRIAITAMNDADESGPCRIIEIADYDPARGSMLVIGDAAPPQDAALHASIYSARRDVFSIASIEDPHLPCETAVSQDYRQRHEELGHILTPDAEIAFEVISRLRYDPCAAVPYCNMLIAVGADPKEASDLLVGQRARVMRSRT
ncbi:MAG: hypothetical protein CVT48_03070 [Thermoplasmata archaeon HGW-Thermoplasmata-1]|nr:MAG: hypothetical protein CVT48_03070 [Thermoplasmata archaeon HGW-Thermoplasmata-1]